MIIPSQGGSAILVLSRKVGEKICIDHARIVVTVVKVEGNQVRIGIEAPREVSVHRGEVQDNVDAGLPAPERRPRHGGPGPVRLPATAARARTPIEPAEVVEFYDVNDGSGQHGPLPPRVSALARSLADAGRVDLAGAVREFRAAAGPSLEVRVVPPTERDLLGQAVDHGAVVLIQRDRSGQFDKAWNVAKFRPARRGAQNG